MSIHVQGLCVITVYAPSGAEKKREREEFFMVEVPHLLPTTPMELLLAGDFNCTLARSDSTGPLNYSRALDTLVTALELHDVWLLHPRAPGYTYYGAHSASRIDRIYVTRQLQMRAPTVDLFATAFSDHHAVMFHVPLSCSPLRRGRGYWKMNVSYFHDKSWLTDFSRQWTSWQQHKKYYVNEVGWWCRYVKPMLRKHFIQTGATMRRDRQQLENFYYAVIYDLLQAEICDATYVKLRQLKAKITRLYVTQQRRHYVDIDELDSLEGEVPSLYQLLRQRTRQKVRLIEHTHDESGARQTGQGAVLRCFNTHMDAKYAVKLTDAEALQALLRVIVTFLPPEACSDLERDITIDELQNAVKLGKPRKAPGMDGICHEFFLHTWDITKHDILGVLNDMYSRNGMLDSQKRGVIVCIPKKQGAMRPSDYRPLTLLNADLKLLARIVATRLKRWISLLLHPQQFCGAHDNNIYGATAALRDTIALSEQTHAPACILSLDFESAFDNIAHSYLMTIMDAHGFSATFRGRIQQMYTNATSVVQLNGYISRTIRIQCSIRQGCPLSMLLFALCINPLLCMIDETLTRHRRGNRSLGPTIITYADDVTIILRSPDEIRHVQEALRVYEAASGARLNLCKSRAMALGSWDTSTDVMGMQYTSELSFLGTKMTATIRDSARRSWSVVTGLLKKHAQDTYHRALTLDNRIAYVNSCLLARVWYVAQVFPPPPDSIRQINTAISWFLWKGAVFRVPLSTLCRDRTRGGWNLINVEAKCKTLLIHRLHTLGMNESTLTAKWLKRWRLHRHSVNPPYILRIPDRFEYLRTLVYETAYIAPQGPLESRRAYKRRMYRTLTVLLQETPDLVPMRIEKLEPFRDWHTIWRNLWMSPVPSRERAQWYKIIHDILPTNVRLHAIGISTTESCRHCAARDTVLHRLVECGQAPEQWDWLAGRVARLLFMDRKWIPTSWLLRPSFSFWPAKRHRAILWLLAHYAVFRTQPGGDLSNEGYIAFLQDAISSMYKHPQRCDLVGSCLTVLCRGPRSISFRADTAASV